MWEGWALALLGVSLALLFVPVDVSVEFERTATLKTFVGVRWLFIRVRRPLAKKVGKEEAQAKPARARRRRRSRPLRTLAEIRRVPGLWSAVRQFVVRMLRAVSVRSVAGQIRFGTGDPADTGRLWAFVWPAIVWSNRWPGVALSAEPDFFGRGLTGVIEGSVRFYPARFLYGIGATVFSLTTIRLVMAVLRSRS